jgi:hypothetical protein
VLGSTETTEDFVFLLVAATPINAEMTVYVAIEGTKIGPPVTIELTRDGRSLGQGHDHHRRESSPSLMVRRR